MGDGHAVAGDHGFYLAKLRRFKALLKASSSHAVLSVTLVFDPDHAAAPSTVGAAGS